MNAPGGSCLVGQVCIWRRAGGERGECNKKEMDLERQRVERVQVQRCR